MGAFEGGVREAVLDSCHQYYYKRENSTLEQDFFVRTADQLVPIEAKARGGRAKSMRTLISDGRCKDIPWGIKLQAGNIGQAGSVRTFPYWCSFLLRDYLARLEE